MFQKVLIANRGAIACRILRTLRRMEIASVAVYSEADRHSLHVLAADESVCLGPAPAAASYLRSDALLKAAVELGVDAIHPGYGFLSENAAFAEACAAAGIAFIGPTPQQMRDFGLKHTARELAAANGVPMLPGSGLLAGLDEAHREANRIGYPVMLKSTAGGGGIGMQLCWRPEELDESFRSVERLAKNNFSQGGLFLEKYVEHARHIEVQIFGDGAGNVVALGERDCSVQRRNQKVIEETPAPGLDHATRSALFTAAERLAKAVSYQSAGTVEFVYDVTTREFYFLEVNTRLQVEHGVTEQVTGIDLVEWMIRVAAGDRSFFRMENGSVPIPATGHSVQVRLYAEDPGKQFQPASGLLTEVSWPQDVRVDTWVETGTEVSAFYDPLLAKLISHAETREAAIGQLRAALGEVRVAGIETNQAYLLQILDDPVFVEGRQTTRMLGELAYQPCSVEVMQGGTHSTVQDYPGRTGYWDIGVPPSGPMDSLAFRLANRLLGNDENAAGLELTVTGPALRFNVDTWIALTGAIMRAELDGKAVPYYTGVAVRAGSVLKMRGIEGAGQRTYLAVRGGFDTPLYMDSRSTFTLGQFGGHGGRTLRTGDVLRLFPGTDLFSAAENGSAPAIRSLANPHWPVLSNQWDIAVLYGPHGAPDFFTTADIESFFATDWEVHYNSSRTGVRLIGPKPEWARRDGGEAGLHPSNIHDNAYAIGSIDFTGDMPVILGPDGPSLGGFVCPATIIAAELWKLGQLRPGDRVRFRRTTVDIAVAQERALDAAIGSLDLDLVDVRRREAAGAGRGFTSDLPAPVLAKAQSPKASAPSVCYRQAGDKYLLVEYGDPVLDLPIRFRVHALMQWLQARAIAGIAELTPGIRSLQIHYDSRVLSQSELLAILASAESRLPAVDDMEVESRIVHLPLSWDDPATRLAIDKYMQSVRNDAPWCPSNIEFIRRINGLDSIQEVQRIVFEASYLVMGLGDVYLGAPVATPLDPRHRLVTTKYNPARTWTPENAVGIGGAYLCVYGMEGPGGYQFVGRTVQMWNRYRQTADFTSGRQWLLRFFDQLRFYPVSAGELLRLREDFIHGRFRLRIEPATLKLRDYRRFLADNAAGIEIFKQRQQAAFDAERERWQAGGGVEEEQKVLESDRIESAPLPPGCTAVASPVSGSVWQLGVTVGQRVAADQELLVVEAMKMEIPLLAEEAGEIVEIRCAPGRAVTAGETLLVVRSAT